MSIARLKQILHKKTRLDDPKGITLSSNELKLLLETISDVEAGIYDDTALQASVSANTASIGTNTTNIGTNTTNIGTNVTDIGTNTTAISLLAGLQLYTVVVESADLEDLLTTPYTVLSTRNSNEAWLIHDVWSFFDAGTGGTSAPAGAIELVDSTDAVTTYSLTSATAITVDSMVTWGSPVKGSTVSTTGTSIDLINNTGDFSSGPGDETLTILILASTKTFGG